MKKLHFKILVDIVMIIMFACLTKIKITGMHMHEVLGCVLGAVVMLHLLLNINWIKSITLRIFDKKLNNKVRSVYAMNLLLLIMFVIVLVSGILVSVTILTNIRTGNRMFYAVVHRKSALITFILVIVHGVMHGRMLKGHCMRMCRKVKGN